MADNVTDTDNAPFLDAYSIHDVAPDFVPARSRRAWMDEFQDRQPYRCLPLTMANATGWELLCPFDLDIEWNGGPNNEDITLSSPDKNAFIPSFATAHFRSGIVTFHTGYVFKTPPGWAVWCMGPPNWPKDGIYPLSGLVETDWLPFPFTMNWQMTRPGKARFEKGEPFCFFTLCEHIRLEGVAPKVKRLSSDVKLERDYNNWTKSRADFNAKLHAGNKEAIQSGWQRHYMKGQKSDGKVGSETHLTKRRMQKPKDLRGSALFKT
jgi:hypothetical protein